MIQKKKTSIKEKLYNFISNPVAVFVAGLVIGSIFFFLSPAHKDSTAPVGIWGGLGYATWGLTLLWFFTAKFILKKKK